VDGFYIFMLAHATKHRNTNYDKKIKRSEDDVGFPLITNLKNSHIFLSQQADAYFSKFQKSGNQQFLHSLKAP